MAKIDSIGTYRGTVSEAVFSLTRNGFPQFVAKLAATERFIEAKSDLAYYVEQGVISDETPQWINWENLDEYIVSYMTLYGNKDGTGEFTPANATLAIKQLQTALGWDGSSFAPLQDGTYNDSQVLFRVAESNNPAYPNLQVAWLDKFDAPATRSLSGIAASAISELDAKLARGMGKKVKVAVAAPPKSPKPTSPPSTPTPRTVTPSKDSDAAPSNSTSPPQEAYTSPSDGCTEAQAWAAVETHSNEDTPTNTDTWISSVAEVAEGAGFLPNDHQFTAVHWAKVRDLTLRDLGISPAVLTA